MQYTYNTTQRNNQPVTLKPDSMAKSSAQITENDYEEVPCGYYMCFINGCERMESKSGKPMLKVSLKIAKACDEANKGFEGRYMWVYQMCTSEIGEQIAQRWEIIGDYFPQSLIKVSKFEKKSKSGNVFVNYKPWLSKEQEEKLNN